MFKQYQEAIENTNITSKTDTDGIITFVNDEFCQISGYTKDELIGKNHNITRHPSVPSSTFKELWDTIQNKQIFKGTVKNRKKDGSTFYVNSTIIPILNENNKIVEYIAIRHDITQEVFYKKELEKKEQALQDLNITLEKKVKDQTKELLQLNQTLEARVEEEIKKNEQKQKVMFWQSRLASLGNMLASISHQWRQPLTQLQLIIFNLKNASIVTKDEKKVLEYYDESKLIIKNMSNTIEDFTNFFIPNREKSYFLVSKSINESLALLKRTLKKENINVTTDLKYINILGIQNELTQIFINLIQNSKDAFIYNNTNKRDIKISTKEYKKFVKIIFKDNAGGINVKCIDNVFEPYFTTKHQYNGTGLGLFMSKMICEQSLNATINVKNVKNGAEFIINIYKD